MAAGLVNVINPFRATLILGTPGSGKSYAVLNNYIKQHIEKGFSMLVYDYKFDDLTRIAYNHLLHNLDNTRSSRSSASSTSTILAVRTVAIPSTPASWMTSRTPMKAPTSRF